MRLASYSYKNYILDRRPAHSWGKPRSLKNETSRVLDENRPKHGPLTESKVQPAQRGTNQILDSQPTTPAPPDAPVDLRDPHGRIHDPNEEERHRRRQHHPYNHH
jgi:hypothetical protein